MLRPALDAVSTWTIPLLLAGIPSARVTGASAAAAASIAPAARSMASSTKTATSGGITRTAISNPPLAPSRNAG